MEVYRRCQIVLHRNPINRICENNYEIFNSNWIVPVKLAYTHITYLHFLIKKKS